LLNKYITSIKGQEYFMSVFKSLATSFVQGSVTGPLKGLHGNKFPSGGLQFPLDVTGPEQGHFIRFNIIEVDGAKFKGDSPTTRSETTQTDAEGNLLTMAAAGIGAAFGGQGGAFGAAFGASVLNNFAPDIAGIAKSKLGPISNALTKVSDAVGDVAGSITEEIPLVKDALSGLGGFPGSIGGIAQTINQGIMPRRESVGDILMYLPMAVSESYKTSWSGKEVGFVGNAVLNSGAAWEDLTENAGSYVKEGVGKAAGGVLGNDSITAINLKTGKVTGQTGGAALAVNPHVEFFFENVTPRTFSFDFKLSPRNPDESEVIQKIIRSFKFHAAPKAQGSEAGRYWEYPQVFQIEYWNSDRTNKIGDCALTDVDVTYSGTGDNHTFYDGQPILVELKLSFQELDIITKDHIEQGF
jgi:hypothetical protein